MSVTVTEAHILSPVVEAYPPNVIIAHAELLPHLLELIYDADDDHNYTVVIVGEPSTQAMARVASKIKILRFDDVEREGNKVTKILTPPPRTCPFHSTSSVSLLISPQNPATSSLSHSFLVKMANLMLPS